ncbi:MAG: hypothetical protein LC130_29160 [Bryobacterales bacterium]|nr:hypothetical protein [Bryobacterales bacterium]
MIIGAPIRGIVSGLAYIRDTIIINDAFLSELNSQITEKKLPADGTATITIAAREIKHAPNYILRLTNYKVVVIADEYDAAGGSIDVSGAAGANGVKGPNGAKGYASATPQNNKDGKPGGPGGSGQPGGKGMPLQLFCKRLKQANLLSRGGSGGSGGAGGTGGEGGNAKIIVVDPDGGKFQEYIGTNGGNGGRGGDGAAGGSGGHVTVRYVERLAGSPSVSITGGAGGVGGAGGAGGKGGYQSANGVAGAKGSNAAKGSNGQANVQQLEESVFWGQLRTLLNGARSDMWAEYRTRMGEYFLRCFAPAKADTAKFLSLAANEFRSILWLRPQEPKAQVMLSCIAANLIPLGTARDFYLTPDFPRYEQAFTDYAPMVQNMVGGAKDLLVHANNVQYNRDRLLAQIAHVQSSGLIIESERAEAAIEKLQAEGVVSGYNGRINALEAEIDAKRHELAQARLELGGVFISSVLEAIGAVAAVVGAVYTGGASLAALPGLLVAAQDSWGKLTTDANGQVKYQDCYLTDWVEWKDGKPVLKQEIKDLGAGMEQVINSVKPAVNATLDLIDKAKVLGDIGQSTVDGELQSELKELLRRKAELEFERAQAKLGVKQAELRLATIDLKAQQAQADLVAAQQMLDTLTADNKLLGRVTAMLIRRAQDYMSHLLQFQFWASRALDIYTMKDHTGLLPFDIGYVHPDMEEDAYTAFRRGSGSHALNLMEAYLTSWARLPGIIILRNEYESYRMDLLTQTQFWSFSGSHSVLQEFRQKGSVEFELGLNDIYQDRFECKIEGATVALAGAVSAEPLINCILMQRGESASVRLDGSVVHFNYPPRGCPLLAVKTAAQINSTPPSTPEAFWGRSPAAKWRLYLEPDTMAKVDLSAVTEILLCFSYKAFIPPLQAAQPVREAASAR